MPLSSYRSPRKKYCSQNCSNQTRMEKSSGIERVCLYCGETWILTKSQQYSNARFCSYECRNEWRSDVNEGHKIVKGDKYGINSAEV